MVGISFYFSNVTAFVKITKALHVLFLTSSCICGIKIKKITVCFSWYAFHLPYIKYFWVTFWDVQDPDDLVLTRSVYQVFLSTTIWSVSLALWYWHHMKAMLFVPVCFLCSFVFSWLQEVNTGSANENTLVTQTQNMRCFHVTSLPQSAK